MNGKLAAYHNQTRAPAVQQHVSLFENSHLTFSFNLKLFYQVELLAFPVYDCVAGFFYVL